jgi:hypothetical protein
MHAKAAFNFEKNCHRKYRRPFGKARSLFLKVALCLEVD